MSPSPSCENLQQEPKTYLANSAISSVAAHGSSTQQVLKYQWMNKKELEINYKVNPKLIVNFSTRELV